MRKKIIIGNWKMNKDWNQTQSFFDKLKKARISLRENLIWGIALPATNLYLASNEAPEDLLICAQDISKHEEGAFTGEISAKMLTSVGANAVVIGHSERRANHNESDLDINQKIKIALNNKLLPIVCVGETLEQYESGSSKEIVKKQLEIALDKIDFTKIVIAYEPIWAIGTGKTATAEYAQEMCKFIRSLTNSETLIQYGGSVNPKNINQILSQDDVDGALVGGASLDVDSFLALVNKN